MFMFFLLHGSATVIKGQVMGILPETEPKTAEDKTTRKKRGKNEYK